jgi:hypothetical protein
LTRIQLDFLSSTTKEVNQTRREIVTLQNVKGGTEKKISGTEIKTGTEIEIEIENQKEKEGVEVVKSPVLCQLMKESHEAVLLNLLSY